MRPNELPQNTFSNNTCTINKAKLQTDIKVLGSELASGPNKIINEDFKKIQSRRKTLSHGKAARMVHQKIKVSDTDESVGVLMEF